MASVDLTTLWLNVVADPADYQWFPFMAALSRAKTKPGRTVALAGGRVRAIRQAGQAVEWEMDLPHCTPQQTAWLEQHAGDLLCARDDRGHKVFGVIWTVPVSEHSYNDDGDVSVTLSEITFSEAV